MHMDRLGHALDRPRTEILEPAIELAPHLLEDRLGDADAAGLGDALQPRGDVDAFAVEVAALHDHVAHVDADPQVDPSLRRQIVVRLRHGRLQAHGALDGVHGTAELDQRAVADQLEDPSAMRRDQRLQDLRAPGPQSLERARLVQLHEPREADHVGGQDGSKSALDPRLGHRDLRSRPSAGVSPAGTRRLVVLRTTAMGALTCGNGVECAAGAPAQSRILLGRPAAAALRPRSVGGCWLVGSGERIVRPRPSATLDDVEIAITAAKPVEFVYEHRIEVLSESPVVSSVPGCGSRANPALAGGPVWQTVAHDPGAHAMAANDVVIVTRAGGNLGGAVVQVLVERDRAASSPWVARAGKRMAAYAGA